MRLLFIACIIFFIAGCGNKNGLPSGVLAPKDMQAVLWDVLQAESFTQQFIKKDTTKNAAKLNADLQQKIFALHKISKEDYFKSYQYYTAHVELMKTILDSITTKAEREKYSQNRYKPVAIEKQ